MALFLSAPAAFADAQPLGSTPVATAGQVIPTTSDTTSTTTLTTDTGTLVSSQSTLSLSGVTVAGSDTPPNDAAGGGSSGNGNGGNGNSGNANLNATAAGSGVGNSDTTGSPATSTGPPGGGTSAGSTSTPTNSTSTSANSTSTPTDSTSTSTDSTGASAGSTSTPTDSSSGSVVNPPSSNAQDVQSEADSQQSGAQNGNVSVRVGNGGGSGSVNQGNKADSSASSSATGDLPASVSDPTATASATTTQDSPSNSNVAVRIDSPGDIAPVGQQNHANAVASATGSNASNGMGGGKATASAEQTSPDNVNVSVRIGSPGDNGDVSQQNTVGAFAGPAAGAAPSAGAVSTAGPAQTDQLVETTSGGAHATNDGTVQQQLLQTQDGSGPDVVVAGVHTVDPAASSSIGSASATQTGAQNINVSIRIGSPGKDGTVTQLNGANAVGTSPDLSVVTVSGGSNLNALIDLPGGTGVAPGDQWSWNWVWTGDGTPAKGATAASVAPTDGPIWNWSWTPVGTATQATSTSAPSASAGLFTWTWNWTTTDGSVWSLTKQQACACNWTWTWTWDWSSGAPASTPAAATSSPVGASADGVGASTAASGPGDDGPVSQSNSVSATADASAAVTATGLLYVAQDGVDPALALQDAENGQSFTNVQTVVAVAQAVQLDSRNVNSVWGVPVAWVSQTNFVEADAAAGAVATLDQELIQGQSGSDGTYQWVGAQQTASNDQQVAAGAQAAQDSALNANLVSAAAANQAAVGSVEQGNSATASVAATAAAALYQGLAQFEDAIGSGVELIDLAQLADSFQFSMIAAEVAQTRTRNVDALVVPAGSRATNPTVRQWNAVTATASSDNTANLSSTAFQYQGGAADIELTSGSQQINLVQSATASAPAMQSDLLNRAGWLGVEPPLPPVPGGGDDGGDGSDAGSPGSATTTGSSLPGSALARVNGLFSSRTLTPSPLVAARPAPNLVRVPRARHLVPAGASGHSAFVPALVPAAAPAAAAPNVGPSTPGLARELAPSPSPSVLARAAGTEKASPLTSTGAPGEPPIVWLHGFPDNPFSAGTGTSGSAPSSGSGQTVLAFGPYKLAAQLVAGPQMPASVLGRPVIFLDPFERPG